MRQRQTVERLISSLETVMGIEFDRWQRNIIELHLRQAYSAGYDEYAFNVSRDYKFDKGEFKKKKVAKCSEDYSEIYKRCDSISEMAAEENISTQTLSERMKNKKPINGCVYRRID